MNTQLTMRCPRCKQIVTAGTEDLLADTMLDHLSEHGHQPPRDHVLARIQRHATRDES